jgi:hypothetical protein
MELAGLEPATSWVRCGPAIVRKTRRFGSRQRNGRGRVALRRSGDRRGLPWITFDLGTRSGPMPTPRVAALDGGSPRPTTCVSVRRSHYVVRGPVRTHTAGSPSSRPRGGFLVSNQREGSCQTSNPCCARCRSWTSPLAWSSGCAAAARSSRPRYMPTASKIASECPVQAGQVRRGHRAAGHSRGQGAFTVGRRIVTTLSPRPRPLRCAGKAKTLPQRGFREG